MCSVRQRPIPSAPKTRARSASSPLSALARTPSRRISSAHSSTRSNSPLIPGTISSTSSTVTRPVEPSIAIVSPACSSVSPTRTTSSSASISSADAPATHGLPIPRAIRAACEDLPPSAVSTPRAAWKPATSSASVNRRTRITSSPASAWRTAFSAVNTIAPWAAPGEAGTPRASSVGSSSGLKVGCRSASSASASIVASASGRPSSPSSTASQANLTEACAGRFAARV